MVCLLHDFYKILELMGSFTFTVCQVLCGVFFNGFLG